MEIEIMLHSNTAQSTSIIKEISDGLNIRDEFIEKDYWITLVLKRLSESKYADSVVFKGGTSLSKGYRLINRFSEDVDIAVINTNEMTGNQIKTLIRTVEKQMTADLAEIEVSGITSKGSRFRKAVYSYQQLSENKLAERPEKSVIVEINSFGNASPWKKVKIQSMIGEYFEKSGRNDLVSKYDLQAFSINVLDKKRTMIEKLASLIRFSFSENPFNVLSGKVRHFYDLYFLVNDDECRDFCNSDKFLTELNEVIKNDKKSFDEPFGWNQKNLAESPLFTDFEALWNKLSQVYKKELSILSFGEIPNENEVGKSFSSLLISLRTP